MTTTIDPFSSCTQIPEISPGRQRAGPAVESSAIPRFDQRDFFARSSRYKQPPFENGYGTNVASDRPIQAGAEQGSKVKSSKVK